MKLNFGLLLMMLILITACGGSGGSSNSKRKARITESQIQDVMNNQIFDCASLSGGACPGGLARLLVLDKDNADDSSVCSGFLVSEDILVTNQHCISSQQVCNNTFVAIYDGHSYEQNRCQKVIKILSDYEDPNDPRKKLDVAIVKLQKKFYGQTFEPSSHSPSVYDALTTWVIDHTGLDQAEPNLYEARVTELQCYVSASRNQSMILDYCPVIDGNSGSPLLNNEGRVAGIIWGGNAADVNSSTELSKRRNLSRKAAATDIRDFIDYL